MNGSPPNLFEESPLHLEFDQELRTGRADTFQDSLPEGPAVSNRESPCHRCGNDGREILSQSFDVWD